MTSAHHIEMNMNGQKLHLRNNMDLNKLIINMWPESQYCIGCKNAIFIQEYDSSYACLTNNLSDGL